MVRKKKPPLRHQGFGEIHSKKLTKSQLRELREKGRTYVVVSVRHGGKVYRTRKKVTPGNVKAGKIYFYYRGDRPDKISLRNFARDYDVRATRKAIRGKGYTGD